MNNQFTYSTRTGNKMRSYVKVAIWIFVLFAAIGVVAAVNRNQMVSEVMATPRPLDSNLIPTETAVVAVLAVPVEDCPSDPASWTLSDKPMAFGSNLKVLTPPCVYDKLEKTAAWVYATTALGYTRADAAAALGLSQQNTLITNLPSVIVLTDFNDEPQAVKVISAVNNSKLAEWRVNGNGETGLEMSFTGCFATSTLTGGQVVSWGHGYPVICQFFADYRTQYVISSANGKLLTIESAKNVRRPIWFGYIGNGNWTWLGSGKVWDVDLIQLPAQASTASTLNSTNMAEKYGLTALPIPQNWQSTVGQEFSDAFLAELNSNQ
jgi:hypothetical protein